MDKHRGGEELTDVEEAMLQGYRKGVRSTHRQKFYEDAPDEIKALLVKRKAGEELTDDERATLRAYMQEHPGGPRGP